MEGAGKFPEDESRGVYRDIQERRDVRSGFLLKPLGDEVLGRTFGGCPSRTFRGSDATLAIHPDFRALEILKAIHVTFLRSNRAALDTCGGRPREESTPA
jgi:hypothetical protein